MKAIFSSCHRHPAHLIIYCPSDTNPEYPLPTYRQQSAKPKCPYITDPYKPFRRNLSATSITFVPNILNENAIILRQSLHRTHQNVPNTDSNQQIRIISLMQVNITPNTKDFHRKVLQFPKNFIPLHTQSRNAQIINIAEWSSW